MSFLTTPSTGRTLMARLMSRFRVLEPPGTTARTATSALAVWASFSAMSISIPFPVSLPVPRWPTFLTRSARVDDSDTEMDDDVNSGDPARRAHQPTGDGPKHDSPEQHREPTLIQRLMNNPALFDPIRAPRHPIVLCHGLYGFDVMGPAAYPKLQIHYW